jgi:hypothetical protein
MPSRDDIAWFKRRFADRIAPALAGTPLTPDLIVAIACQETGVVWSALRRAGSTRMRCSRCAWATRSMRAPMAEDARHSPDIAPSC